MKVIGFNFTKINAEVSNSNLTQLKINAKMDISSIDSLKSSLLNTGEDIIGVGFTYSLQYEPNFAKIDFTGNLIFSIEPKLAEEILNEWKDKKIPEKFKIFLFNVILRKSNLKALELEDELGLPPHISFPSLKKSDSSESKED
jgi:hypothetical protein